MSERWVPRCRNCQNGHIVVAPSPCDPNTEPTIHDWRTSVFQVYCIECGHTTPITELLYVRL